MGLELHSDIALCVDCVQLIANGEGPDETNAALAERWPSNEFHIGLGDGETYFSWSPCDGCGDHLGGDRLDSKAYTVTP